MYGRITVDEHTRRVALGEHLHVLLDGVDVTRRCRKADDCEGFVVLFVHRNGRVEIVPGEPF